MEDIIAKAKELGTMIRDSRQMSELNRCEENIERDEKAKELLNDYKQLQVELIQATREEQEAQVIEEIKERLLAKHRDISSYETTGNYLKAKDDFDGFINQINNVIMYTVTGEEPCGHANCSSCGGGCKEG